jgi:PKD repeat protein
MFSWGLRNPFRIAFDPNAAGTRFFINDVGQGSWEEIDEGQANADFGWNCREGAHTHSTSGACNPTPPGMVDPIYEYGRATGCNAITGGAFVPNGVWPAEHDGDYLYSDYGCGKIFKLEPGGGYTATEFVTGLGGSSAVHMAFGPYSDSQALYYTTYAAGGQVRRIAYVGNRSPIALISANPTSGPAPLTVNFDGAASSDPDAGDTLTFDWDFGDGSAHATTPAATHQYALGTYTATLTVSDGNGGTGTATVRIDSGNTRPAPAIDEPDPGLRYRVGQQITLQGSATDAEDGQIPPSGLSWRVLLHHDQHTHPFLPPTQGISVTITTPAPEDLAATQTSYLEIVLTAADSQGLTEVVTQELRPNLVDITFATVPAGRRLLVNSSTVTGTQALVSWEGYTLNVSAPLQKDGAGQWLALASWADGGPVPTRAIVTPATARTYTATFGPAKLEWLPVVRRPQ